MTLSGFMNIFIVKPFDYENLKEVKLKMEILINIINYETTKAASNSKTAILIATTNITWVSEEVLCAIKTKERSNALNLKL